MKKDRLLLLLAMIGMMFFVACKGEKHEHTTTQIEIEFVKDGELFLKNNDSIIKKIDIEYANTDSKRQIGLMNRSQMNENEGMLFVFDEDNTTGFWMKDTRIPLDIIFVGADSTIINVQKNAKPYDQNTYAAKAPYRYALEVNGGSADKWGIVEGQTKLSWELNKDK